LGCGRLWFLPVLPVENKNKTHFKKGKGKTHLEGKFKAEPLKERKGKKETKIGNTHER
jgi:hypothetical protein